VIFVVPDLLPSGLSDFVALHERGEELSLGNHYFASQLEFAAVSQAKKVRTYAKFIDDNFPSKFVDLMQKVNFPILPDELAEYIRETKKSSGQELKTAESMINSHPLPLSVLRKVEDYNNHTDAVCEAIRLSAGPVQRAIYDLRGEENLIREAANLANGMLADTFRKIPYSQLRVAPRARIAEFYGIVMNLIKEDAFKIIGGHLNVPVDFGEAYQRAIKGKRIVEVA
jgi:hypothetical protein